MTADLLPSETVHGADVTHRHLPRFYGPVSMRKRIHGTGFSATILLPLITVITDDRDALTES